MRSSPIINSHKCDFVMTDQIRDAVAFGMWLGSVAVRDSTVMTFPVGWRFEWSMGVTLDVFGVWGRTRVDGTEYVRWLGWIM